MAKAVKYISIKQLAELSGKSKMTLVRWCQSGKVQYRTVDGNGGTRYEILVSSLDKKFQDIISLNSVSGSTSNTHTNTPSSAAGFSLLSKTDEKDLNLQNMSVESLPAFSPFTTGGVDGQSSLLHFTSKPVGVLASLKVGCKASFTPLTVEQEQTLSLFKLNDMVEIAEIIPPEEKKKALTKVDLLLLWQEFRKNYKGNKTRADKDFVELYNSGHVAVNIFNKLGTIGLSTLRRYEKLYKESRFDYKVLIPNYNYGCESRLQSSLTPIEKYLLVKYMLHQNCYALGRAYQLIGLELNNMGEFQHSYSAYRRVWEYITRNYYAQVVYAREGLKACRDKALPYIIRKKDVLNFGDEIIGDGHTLDFMVQNPFNGKPCRATLIGFLDSASGDLVGYDIMLTENTQAIASALRNSIIYMGKYPKVVHLDNGKAFRGKFFTADGSLASTSMQGIYKKMGIETLFSRAYNGRAKTIERFFKEFTESEAKTWSTYIGNNIDSKPAHTRRNEKFHKKLAGDYVPTIAEVKAGIDYWLDNVYRKRFSKTDDGLTIAEYVEQERGEGVDINELDDLMMAEEKRKIQRNGVKLFDTYYWSEKLFNLNAYCIIKYSFFDLSFVKVYSLKGQFICKAERMQEFHPLAKYSDNPKDYEEYKYQSRLIARVEKNVTGPMNKILKQMYLPAVQHSYKKIEETGLQTAPPLLEDKNILSPKNIIDIEPVVDDDYQLDTELFAGLLAERQAEM